MTSAPDQNRTDRTPPAIIIRCQVAALEQLLRRHENRNRYCVVQGKLGQGPSAALIDVCPIALAEVTGCFVFDPAVIAIVEEAQFEQMLITISQADAGADIVMRLSVPDDIDETENLPMRMIAS